MDRGVALMIEEPDDFAVDGGMRKWSSERLSVDIAGDGLIVLM